MIQISQQHILFNHCHISRRAVRVNNNLIVTPLRGVNLLTNTLVSGGVKAQAKKAIANVVAILNEAQLQLSDVSKLTVHLVDLDDLTVVNGVLNSALVVAGAWPVSIK